MVDDQCPASELNGSAKSLPSLGVSFSFSPSLALRLSVWLLSALSPAQHEVQWREVLQESLCCKTQQLEIQYRLYIYIYYIYDYIKLYSVFCFPQSELKFRHMPVLCPPSKVGTKLEP